MKRRSLLASLLMLGLSSSCAAVNDWRTVVPDAPTDPSNPQPQPNPNPNPGGCSAINTYTAETPPAAMLIVLDRSSSMSQGGKWVNAGNAIVQAIDQDVFDSMSIGLYMAPSGSVTGPACIFNLPVSCKAPTVPQIGIQAAGALKSAATSGVRSDIRRTLQLDSPDTGLGDASPLYAAVDAGIKALRAWAPTGRRLMLIVTDGTISCNQLSSPARPGYPDGNGCAYDWENPDNIITLLKNANLDASQPIDTFLIGVPGADTYDPSGVNYPPYHMRLALSAMAYAGSPANVPAGCTGKTYTKAGGDPTVSCHFDLTQGALNAQAMAQVIGQVRGKIAGCAYNLPTKAGVTIDKSQVNVTYTIDTVTTKLYRRKDASNTCAYDGCWDYNAAGQVELIGQACSAVKTAAKADVKVEVGCATIVG